MFTTGLYGYERVERFFKFDLPISVWRPQKGDLQTEDPDQTLQNAASDQDLHCLQVVLPFFCRKI